MTAYYNEFDKHAAQWLRELIAEGHIAPGDVDERDIQDVLPSDLAGYAQCHFFAGIGVWSYALRRAGWDDSRPVWTGSCPCQPFSAAGKGKGVNDERHLWPAFARLISACRPAVIFGEQVASSLVIGKRTSPDLQRLWERKAHLGILADWLEKDISIDLQGVPQQIGAHASPDAQGVNGNQGVEINCSSKITRIYQGAAVRSDCAMGSGSAGLWSLRGYRDSFRYDLEAGVEYTVSGSDSGGLRIHNDEHPGGALRAECGLWELGREPSDRDGKRDYEIAKEAIRGSSAEADRAIEAENGESWLDTLRLDLEGTGYAFGAVDLCSAGVGAPHIRQRLYWVADSAGERRDGRQDTAGASGRIGVKAGGAVIRLGNANGTGLEGLGRGHKTEGVRLGAIRPTAETSEFSGLADAGNSTGQRGESRPVERGLPESACEDDPVRPGPTNGFWRASDWLGCRDGKWRPIEPGTFPLAHGAAARVVKLRGYGNAVNAKAAETFVSSYLECRA